MYHGLIKHNRNRPTAATRVQRYGMKNNVHSVMVSGMGAEEYYGPPRPGQSFAQYQSFMSLPIAAGMGGAAIGAIVAGPIGAIVGGVGSWLLTPRLATHAKVKSQTQGG